MDSVAYSTVYDASASSGFDVTIGIPMVLIAVCLALVVGARMIAGPDGAGRYSASHVRALGVSGLGICSLVVLGMLWQAANDRRLRDDLRAGRFVQVEGTVSHFVAGDRGGHEPESWSVESGGETHRYTYRRTDVSEFHNRSRAVKDGVRVRIANIDGHIERLEVEHTPSWESIGQGLDR